MRQSRRRFLSAAGPIGSAALMGAMQSGAQTASGKARPLVLAIAEYQRFSSLELVGARQAGLEVKWLRGERNEMLRRAISDPAVDGGEGSMAAHLIRLDGGDRSMVALPVFVLRNFTARDVYTRADSRLKAAEWNGRRIGIYNWAASGATWYRHLIRYLGQDPKRIRWVVGSPDQQTHPEPRGTLPGNVERAPEGSSLSDLLLAGKLDAFFAPLPPLRAQPGQGQIVRLFRDFRTVEKEYFQKTGCYPVQHVLLLRRANWERDPSIGKRLVELFQNCESKFEAAQRLFPYSTPWQIADVEETEKVMGREFHAHGLEKNRRVVDVFCQGIFDDGVTRQRLSVDDVFGEFVKANQANAAGSERRG